MAAKFLKHRQCEHSGLTMARCFSGLQDVVEKQQKGGKESHPESQLSCSRAVGFFFIHRLIFAKNV